MKRIKNILFIEDSEVYITYFKSLFGKDEDLKHIQLNFVKSITEASKLIKDYQFDLILLDLNLEDSSGIDSIKSIRDIYNGVIIVVTSYDGVSIGIQALRNGADDFIKKSNLVNSKVLKERLPRAYSKRVILNESDKVIKTLDKLIF